MSKRTCDYDEWFIEKLTDPRIAADYINSAVREHPENIKTALGNVAKAYTMKKVAKEAGVARESLYPILSESGNPTLSVLTGILKAVGLRIAVVPDSDESGIENPQAGVAAAGNQPQIERNAPNAITEMLRSSSSFNVPASSLVHHFAASEEGLGKGFSFQAYAKQLASPTSIGTRQATQ